MARNPTSPQAYFDYALGRIAGLAELTHEIDPAVGAYASPSEGRLLLDRIKLIQAWLDLMATYVDVA
jgi:hypothetical protein